MAIISFSILGVLGVIGKIIATAALGATIKIVVDKVFQIRELREASSNAVVSIRRNIRRNFQDPLYFETDDDGRLLSCKGINKKNCETLEQFVTNEGILGNDVVCDTGGTCLQFRAKNDDVL